MKIDVRKAALGVLLLSTTAGSLLGCSRKGDEAAKPGQSVAPPATPSQAPSAEVRKDKIMRLPSGPVLEILPGEGVGAIRFGATVETIERLMAAPCEFKTDKACRYVGRAIEFFLDDKGATNEMRIHRVERPTTPEGRTFGIFNGRMRTGLSPMMIPTGVRGLIGEPKKVEKVADGGPAHTVEVDTYDGMRIEYDALTADHLVVGGIILTKSATAAASFSKLPPQNRNPPPPH